MSYKERFIDTVVDNSIANDWNNAKLEWGHTGSYEQHGSNCICGQCITEVCTIQNYQNGIELEVGNVCINKFLDIDRKSDFKLIKKNKIDWKLLLELKKDGVITDWEMLFYDDIKQKRKLTDRQIESRDRIIKKCKDYIMRNKKKNKGIIDPYAFKNLKENMKYEHKVILLQHIKEVGIKIKDDAEILDIMHDLKSILVSLNDLKKL